MMKLNEKREQREQRKSRQIHTKSGIVEGKQLHCNKGPIDIFLGIPYAKPPIGERRFKVSLYFNPLNFILAKIKKNSAQ